MLRPAATQPRATAQQPRGLPFTSQLAIGYWLLAIISLLTSLFIIRLSFAPISSNASTCCNSTSCYCTATEGTSFYFPIGYWLLVIGYYFTSDFLIHYSSFLCPYIL